MTVRLTESALALLAAGCEAHGIEVPASGTDLESWADSNGKDEIMKHDLTAAIAAAARFDVPQLGSCLHSARTFLEPRDRPINRRPRDLAGDQ